MELKGGYVSQKYEYIGGTGMKKAYMCRNSYYGYFKRHSGRKKGIW
jgi:hypothetical protein